MQLSNDEIRRYSRHLILPEVGLPGQKKICSTSVLCIGAGGLGSPIAMYLAAAGIGKLGIVDFDNVDFSNLQRQILHTDADVGRPKAQSAKETINGINPGVEVVLHNTRLTSENAIEIIKLALGKGSSLLGRLLLFNALDMKFRELNLRQDPQCPLCGENPTITGLIDYEMFCGITPEPETPVQNPDEVTVNEMKKALEDPKLGIKVIDVREPDEYQIARIDGVSLYPLSTLPQRFTELDPNHQYYIHCKSGVRSMKALKFLREQGFKYLKNVKGGITAWADEIDHNVPKY